MFIQILLFCGLCYLIWKKTEKIKIRTSVRPYHLYYLPILQSMACLLFCAFTFIIIDSNTSLTEINNSINNKWFGDDISSILSDSGFTPDEISYYLIVENLEFVLKCLEKSLKEYLYKCHRYHCFCRFRQEFVINSEPSIVFQP